VGATEKKKGRRRADGKKWVRWLSGKVKAMVSSFKDFISLKTSVTGLKQGKGMNGGRGLVKAGSKDTGESTEKHN